uniref:Uncharacterized protein n=1 Tax=Arundo donax TaxID=35708 RepID=A0A0A9G8C6_ARUDO
MYLHAISQRLFLHIEPKKQSSGPPQKPSLPSRLFTFINKSTLFIQLLSSYVVNGDMDIQICYAPFTS